MKPDVLWLVRLGLDQGIFTREHCVTVRSSLGDDTEIADFAQKLIDEGFVENVETLEKVAGLAMTKGRKGPPSDDPFIETGTPPSFTVAGTASPFSTKAPMGAPRFEFERITTLDTASLAKAFRELLRETLWPGKRCRAS